MTKYKAHIPHQDDMGSIEPMIVKESRDETKEQCALWHINNMRQHDRLKPLRKLPAGVTFERLE